MKIHAQCWSICYCCWYKPGFHADVLTLCSLFSSSCTCDECPLYLNPITNGCIAGYIICCVFCKIVMRCTARRAILMYSDYISNSFGLVSTAGGSLASFTYTYPEPLNSPPYCPYRNTSISLSLPQRLIPWTPIKSRRLRFLSLSALSADHAFHSPISKYS